jgi:hypothetical protein
MPGADHRKARGLPVAAELGDVRRPGGANGLGVAMHVHKAFRAG